MPQKGSATASPAQGNQATEASPRPPRRTLTALALSATPAITLCALAGIFALSTGVARAEAPKLIPYGTFPAHLPVGVAVDQPSGDVFVAGLSSESETPIEKFDATGKLISPPPSFGTNFEGGAAINPTNGDLYVFNLTGSIQTFDPTSGEMVGSPFPVSVSGGLFERFLQIAADASGNVYVPDPSENTVLEYSPTGTLLSTFTGGTGPLNGPSGVAVDSTGNLWVADTGNNRIEELSPADTPIGEIKNVQGVQRPALDGHGDVLAIVKNGADFCGSVVNSPPCSHLVEYNAAGAQVADVGAGSFETGSGPGQLPPMVAVSEASGRVYVSDGKGERVWIFGPPVPVRVEKELASEVGVSEAKLGALVNPGGLETTYRFEYGTTTAYGQSVPFPEGSVGEGLASRAVWAAASGLAPGTTYHFRVIATSELGEAAGPDETFTTETVAQTACPNEQLRGGFAAGLPDCRAYELVTPPTKTSVQVDGASSAAIDGNAVGFGTHEPLPGAPTGGNDYIATRGAGGWSSENVNPLESYTGAVCESHSAAVPAYSDELSKALVRFGHDSRASEPEGGELSIQECNAEGLQVVPGEPVGYQNLLLRDNSTGAFRLVNAPPAGVTPSDAYFKGASADLSHVVFSELAQLTSEAPAPAVGGPEDLYEWDEGTLRLLSVLPDGTPAQGALAEANGTRGISADGSRIVFTSGGSLYVRVDGSNSVQVDASQTGGSGGGGSFQSLSAGGSEGWKVLFTDENRLTPDSTAAAGEPDLYQCVLPEGASSCELTDLTVAKAGGHADVLKVSGLASKDSAHLYFVAKGVLAEGAEGGQPNLYLWDGARTTFIATLTEGDPGAGAVSPDGAWFAFESRKGLTGSDNILPGGGPQPEVFLYSAASNQLACASCNPSGEAPVGGGASLPSFARRPLADGGRLIFGTREALVPSDTNGQEDVYEYEGGRQSLISSGTSPRGSTFDSASESGNDAFFLSSQQLVPQDTQEEAHLMYDARVNGGFPAGSSPPPCTTADACRSVPAPQPRFPSAGVGTAAVFGEDNLAPPPQTAPRLKPKPLACRRGFVRKKVKGKSRCVRKPTRKARKAHAKKRGH
jgi:hypothetical protein